MEHEVLLFYKYVSINEPKKVADMVRGLSIKYGFKGRAIVAKEGINATLEGTKINTQKFLDEFLKDKRLCDIQVKRSESDGASFPKLSVKVRDEIVGTKFPKEVDPTKLTGVHIKPEELKEWYKNKEDFVVVDMRNNYEFASGHFKDSINPNLENSRDLVKAVEILEPLKTKKLITVCTGGVRCEKMSAYLIHKGFKDVYQLDGGIHSYIEKYPAEDFVGGLYTFDQRQVMHFGGEREIIGRCRLCKAKTEKYVNCSNLSCHLHFLACENCQSEEGTYCSPQCKEHIDARMTK